MRSSMQITKSLDGDLKFSGTVCAEDMVRLNLDAVDRQVVDECGQGGGRPPADWLLALEIIFRRSQEQGI